MNKTPMWGDKPYYSLNEYCKNIYQEKLYKIALDAGFTCPNRDGTLDTRGCIFCSAGGSGDFAIKTYDADVISNFSVSATDLVIPNSSSDTAPILSDSVHFTSVNTNSAMTAALSVKSIDKQIEEGLSLFRNKKIGSRFIAYFQAYTNTYGPISYLKTIYTQALSHPAIAGISIATRPDCLSKECLQLLSSLQQQFPDKFIWIELGLQTIHETTARFIRRGYPLSVFENAMQQLQIHQIPVIVHVILGLPGETDKMQYETISYLNQFTPFGIKLQLLHILKGTDLANYYQKSENFYEPLTLEHYLTLLIECIEHLSPDIVIHRVTGDGPKDLLLAPTWSLNKRNVLNSLHQKMRAANSYQGKQYTTDLTLEP